MEKVRERMETSAVSVVKMMGQVRVRSQKEDICSQCGEDDGESEGENGDICSQCSEDDGASEVQRSEGRDLQSV